MFRFQTSIRILKKGLSYRKISFMKKQFLYLYSSSFLRLAPSIINPCCSISNSKYLSEKNGTKLNSRIFSDEEIDDDKFLSESITELADEDKFGYVQVDHPQQVRKERRSHGYNMNRKDSQRNDMEDAMFSNELKQSNSYTHDLAVRRKLKKAQQNTFGTLSHEKQEVQEDYHQEEEEDMKPHIRLSGKGRRNEPYWYSKKIKEYGQKGQVKEAIKVFDVWMLQNDRVMPDKYVISHLLTVLAEAGYTKKAFQVFNQSKKLGIQPNKYMYSALFNACANSPWPADGLARAKLTLEDMALREITLNSVTFNCMIKAFAMCGDAKTAFLLADKYADAQKLDAEAFCHVLMAAITDKKAGFWYAVQVWRWMLIKRIKPTIKLYNLLLRAIKECGVNDPILTQQLFLPVNPAATMNLFKKEKLKGKYDLNNLQLDTSKALPSAGTSNLLPSIDRDISQESYVPSEIPNHKDLSLSLPDNKKEFDIDTCYNSETSENNTLTTVSEQNARLPNILNPKEDLSHIISITSVSTGEDRFALVGGMTGFLTDMENNGVNPTLETFDQMLTVISPDSEEQLLNLMNVKGLKPDIDLLTNLAYRRCCRFDYASAKSVLELTAIYKLVPNMRTYSVLAMTCNKQFDGMQLIRNMKAASIVPNIHVMGALLRSSNLDFRYKKALLNEMEESGLLPDQKFIKSIEFQMQKARQLILKMEKEKKDNTSNFMKLDTNYEDFKQFYKSWLKRMDLDVPEHPWKSFREKKADIK